MTRHIIIGSSAVGVSAMRKLRSLDADAEIICISDEQESPYNKCFLADYLGQKKTEEQLLTLKADYCADNNIVLMLGTRVEKIDSQAKKIICTTQAAVSGKKVVTQELMYDTLLIGTGVSPLMPPIEGAQDSRGVFMFHRQRDATAIMGYLKERSVTQAVVIGAGLSGLEAADALTTHGIAVAVVDRAAHVLGRQVDATGSMFIERKMQEAGVIWRAEQQAKKIISQKGFVTGLELASGELLPAQLIIVAVGATPNSALAKEAGIEVQDGAIVTDNHMMTTMPGIYAAGDVALVRDQLSGSLVRSCTWPDAMMQGMVAASAMAGAPTEYAGMTAITSSSFFGLKFATCGPVVEAIMVEVPKTCEVVLQESEELYQALLLQNGILKGFLLVGHTKKVPMLKKALLTREQINLEAYLD